MTTSKPTNQPADRNRQPNAVTRRLFLSCVSHEFRFYRDVLATHLAQPGVELRRQEDFINTGRTTLEKLNDYISGCDAVIHLVGYGTGAYPMPAEVQTLQTRLKDFDRRVGWDPAVPLAHLSYTQWEAWLAIYHAKPLALYRAADVAQRESGFVRDDRQRAEQDQHWRRLEALGRDRKEFVSPHDLSIEVLRALPLLVPGFQDNMQQGQTRDRNLLFAVLALQDQMLSRGSFVEICKRWAQDMQVPLADLMLREGLIDAADRALVDARVERKLKARGGDIRQSLADSLGTDARQSLGEALDAQNWANLPDRLAGLAGRETTATSWRYRLTRTHGIGGLGVVSVAQDCGLERDVAIKQLKADRLLDPMAIDRFIREARITGQLQHPNIIPVYELGLTPGDQIPFYAMRFVGHRTLLDAIAHHYTDKQVSAREKNLRFRSLIQSFIAVCNAVAYAHEQKVIHRDIKPANVMIGDFGEVILLDWGLAKRIDEALPGEELTGEESVAGPAGQTRLGARLGSPAYMAPEQAAGQIDQHGPLTDIYGLGATLYELLTGDVPFSGTTTEELFTAIQTRTAPPPHSRNPNLSPALSAICLQAMAKRPQDRYASARDLATDLLQWLADEPVTAYSEPLAARAQRLARKYPGPLSATAATVLVGALGLGLGLYRVNIERGKAVVAQAEAEQNFLLARDTVNGFVTSISRDELSVVPGMQDLRVSMARKAREQNEIFAANRPTDPQVIAALGESRVNYSQVLLSIGPVDAAVAEALRGVAELEQAAQLDASDDLQVRWARGLSNLSDLYRELGQYGQALPYVHKAMEILEPRSRSQDKRTDIQYELARGLNILGNCLSESNERIVAYERARNLASAILATHPRPAEAHQVYAAATFNLANRFYDNTDAQRKLELLQQAQQADQQVLSWIPNAPRAVSNHSLGLEETGATLARLGRIDEARQTFDLAEETGRKVVAQNPKVTQFYWLLASTLKRRAEFHSKVHEFANSLRYYEEARSILETLVDRVDDRPQYAETWIEVCSAIAAFHQGLPEVGGKRDDAAWQTQLNLAVVTADRCVERFPAAIDLRYQLGKVLRERSLYHNEEGNWEASRQDLTRACELFEEFVLPRTEAMDDYRLIAYVDWLARVIPVANKLADRALAESTAKKAATLTDRISDPEAAESLGTVLEEWGKICRQEGRVSEAIQAYETELSVSIGPFARVPWHWYLRSNVADAHFALAELYQAQGDVDQEVKHRQAWLRIWGAYFLGLATDTYLDPTPAPSQAEAERLRQHMANQAGMISFSVPCDFGGRKYRISIYVSDCPWPRDPLEDQARWLEEIRGGVIPLEVRDSFRKLHQIAHENQMSFKELCAYAMESSRTPEEKLTRVEDSIAGLLTRYEQAATPDNARPLVAEYAKKAVVLNELERYQDALDAFREAVKVCLEIVEMEAPEDDVQWALEELESLQSRFSATKLLYIASGDMATILGNEPDVIPLLLQFRATYFAEKDQYPEVRDAADRLLAFDPPTAQSKYNAACAYSLGLAILQRTDWVDAINESQREELGRLAVQAMTEAIASGWDRFDQIATDAELEAIRDLPEFQALLPPKDQESNTQSPPGT